MRRGTTVDGRLPAARSRRLAWPAALELEAARSALTLAYLPVTHVDVDPAALDFATALAAGERWPDVNSHRNPRSNVDVASSSACRADVAEPDVCREGRPRRISMMTRRTGGAVKMHSRAEPVEFGSSSRRRCRSAIDVMRNRDRSGCWPTCRQWSPWSWAGEAGDSFGRRAWRQRSGGRHLKFAPGSQNILSRSWARSMRRLTRAS